VSLSARLVLEIGPRRAHSPDDLRARFVVTNTGTVPLWLNARLLLGAGRRASPFQEVWVDINGHRWVAWWGFFNTPPVGPTHYRLLPPGDSAGRKATGPSEDLRCLGLDAPGRYMLTAHYRDGNDLADVPPPPPGSVYLGWELVSEPVAVEIDGGSSRGSRRFAKML